ncbi:MAG: hypothetical protein RR877_09035, partial [Aurantimicrobium sp.]|uniref:hypothetical protein n=1 Tax=Aurantimicrobium sp. TaxID=1930784 RepID=UPI002FC8CA1A
QTKSALLGGLEGLTERWALFCCLGFLQNVHKISGSFTLGNVNAKNLLSSMRNNTPRESQ